MPRGPWIQTYSGRKFHPLDPRPEDIFLEDIVHSLSHICRFNGHCNTFYSVAQHSVLVAEVARAHHPSSEFWGLMHDASEAFVGDVTRPVKVLLATFRDIEERIAQAIRERFEIPYDAAIAAAVHDADNQLLATEARDLMAAPPDDWDVLADPLVSTIAAWSPSDARERFRAAFEDVARGTGAERAVTDPASTPGAA